MIHVVLFEPEIPPNTGNIIRLCANTGTCLHLIRPLGFKLDDTRLQRAGLDYHEWASVREHDSYDDFIQSVQPEHLFAFSTKGKHSYTEINFQTLDHITLLFGPETRGLPEKIRKSLNPGNVLRIPMLPDSRSLNLSNAVAIVVYEVLRQTGFNNLK